MYYNLFIKDFLTKAERKNLLLEISSERYEKYSDRLKIFFVLLALVAPL